ncbi:MAG: hypothetical protein ACI8PT_000373 [Gammaproteobacteria bacterium]|jgi:hypothetical protein
MVHCLGKRSDSALFSGHSCASHARSSKPFFTNTARGTKRRKTLIFITDEYAIGQRRPGGNMHSSNVDRHHTSTRPAPGNRLPLAVRVSCAAPRPDHRVGTPDELRHACVPSRAPQAPRQPSRPANQPLRRDGDKVSTVRPAAAKLSESSCPKIVAAA